MRRIGSRLLPVPVLLLLVTLPLACGKKAELSPELQAQLDGYERLIETYEKKFAETRGDHEAFARVSASYTDEARAWMSQWEALTPDLSEEEGKAIKASIDELNKRALRMLGG